MFPVTIIDETARKQGLEYLVIGGHAVNCYCEPRSTLDVDFLICKDDRDSWARLLTGEGFKLLHDGDSFLQYSPPYGVEWRLDLMLVNRSSFDRLRSDARDVDLLGIRTKVPKVEHLIAMKLHALRHGHAERFEKDFGDVISLTRNAKLDPYSESYRQMVGRYGTAELYERILLRLG